MSKLINLSNNTKTNIGKIVNSTEILTEALAELKEFGATFPELIEQKENLKLELAEEQARISGEILKAEVDAKEKIRAITVDRDLKIKADKIAAFEGLADDLNMAILTMEGYNNLASELNETKKAIDEAIEVEKSKGRRQLEAALKNQTLSHEKETVGLNKEIEMLKQLVIKLEAQIEDYRNDRAEMHKSIQVASTASAVNQQIGKV